MNHSQQLFLNHIAELIPRLMAVMQAGSQHAEYVLGTRRIKGRQVRLILRAEVVDPGMNPLATHSAGRQPP